MTQLPWVKVLYLAGIALIAGVALWWWRHQRGAVSDRHRTWAESHGWQYLGSQAKDTEGFHFPPFTNDRGGRNVWVVSGRSGNVPFRLGVFEYNTMSGDAATVFQHPWVWVECPSQWEDTRVEIPWDSSNLHWRTDLNVASRKLVTQPVLDILSTVPGFTFFISRGRLGVVSTEYLEDQSGPVSQGIDNFMEKMGAEVVDDGHSYDDYEQLMTDKLNVVLKIRAQIFGA